MNFFKNKFKAGKRNLHMHAFIDSATGVKALRKARKEAWFLCGVLFFIGPFWYKYWTSDQKAKLMVIYDEEHLPSFLHIRAKPYGWKCFNCNMLDFACQKECKAENAKKKELYEAYLKKKEHDQMTKL